MATRLSNVCLLKAVSSIVGTFTPFVPLISLPSCSRIERARSLSVFNKPASGLYLFLNSLKLFKKQERAEYRFCSIGSERLFALLFQLQYRQYCPKIVKKCIWIKSYEISIYQNLHSLPIRPTSMSSIGSIGSVSGQLSRAITSFVEF